MKEKYVRLAKSGYKRLVWILVIVLPIIALWFAHRLEAPWEAYAILTGIASTYISGLFLMLWGAEDPASRLDRVRHFALRIIGNTIGGTIVVLVLIGICIHLNERVEHFDLSETQRAGLNLYSTTLNNLSKALIRQATREYFLLEKYRYLRVVLRDGGRPHDIKFGQFSSFTKAKSKVFASLREFSTQLRHIARSRPAGRLFGEYRTFPAPENLHETSEPGSIEYIADLLNQAGKELIASWSQRKASMELLVNSRKPIDQMMDLLNSQSKLISDSLSLSREDMAFQLSFEIRNLPFPQRLSSGITLVELFEKTEEILLSNQASKESIEQLADATNALLNLLENKADDRDSIVQFENSVNNLIVGNRRVAP